jgi:hypothetical protein
MEGKQRHFARGLFFRAIDGQYSRNEQGREIEDEVSAL